MNLQEICKDERFAKSELFAARINGFFLGDGNQILGWYDACGVKQKLNRTGFSRIDLTSDEWKLYELIDGKMVEVETKRICHSCHIELGTIFPRCGFPQDNGDWLCPSCFWGDKLTISEEEVTNAEEEMTNIIGNMMWEVEEDNQSKAREEDSSKCQCLDPKNLAWLARFYRVNKLEERLANQNNYSEKIMQPTEAIRWMRENPGKVIVAVEDEAFQLAWDKNNSKVSLVSMLFYNERCANTWVATGNMSSELTFFAYTYKELKE